MRTPHIDSLARGGFRAEHNYVATPICMPNRATLMTGRMPSAHGVRHNGIELALEETTFVDVLREAGYRTALVGKGHLQNITSAPPQWPPGPRPLWSGARVDVGEGPGPRAVAPVLRIRDGGAAVPGR